MPKQIGFNLYALIVYYKDGNRCVCYARKTDEWYYFSDKMDFRIQLAGDNRTITKQEWRRKHYESSWYESVMLDYVDLMEFGETYLQDELNPIRTDIINNHTDIINNYNEFITNQQNMWNVIQAGSMDEYTTLLRLYLHQTSAFLDYLSLQLGLNMAVLAENFNNLVTVLSNVLNGTWTNSALAVRLPTKSVEYATHDFTSVDENGNITESTMLVVEISESDGVSVKTNGVDPPQVKQDIVNLQSRVSSLESRVTALENK